jgi:hypothetical protein
MKWPRFLRQRDNETPCVVRIGWFFVFWVLLWVTAWTAYKGINFDFGVMTRSWTEFLAAASISIAGKAMTEPKVTNGGN